MIYEVLRSSHEGMFPSQDGEYSMKYSGKTREVYLFVCKDLKVLTRRGDVASGKRGVTVGSLVSKIVKSILGITGVTITGTKFHPDSGAPPLLVRSSSIRLQSSPFSLLSSSFCQSLWIHIVQSSLFDLDQIHQFTTWIGCSFSSQDGIEAYSCEAGSSSTSLILFLLDLYRLVTSGLNLISKDRFLVVTIKAQSSRCPKPRQRQRIQYKDRFSLLPPSLEPAPSGRSVRTKHNSSAQPAAPASSTSQAQRKSNQSNKTNSNSNTPENLLGSSCGIPFNLSSEAHKQVLKICEDTRPENQVIETIGFLSYIQRTVKSGLANRPLALQSAAVDSWKPSDVLKKYIKSKDKEFIAAQYPPGYGTPDGSAATKAVNDWANRLATDTRSRLRNVLLTNVKPVGKTIPTHPMPSLKHLVSLQVHHTFILQTDPRTEDQIFANVSKDFKHRLALLLTLACCAHFPNSKH
ncbi:uncharacterized protein MELLADRAFT_89729 [Melampsora larici-populina 98AG31]|uniref:Uncharacterized protein n=1 Tax=Melampsora larici-populina (strain 98AG31 / pathotype 3-4-7) TaxID=747676 RepID=F4RUE6_MELLP|nr:uncharacterized protein MELLADRAFT_89729 [Melampsora larici-populina 98AG31]EGG03920.1 hypothetical protein MELLADRAFT_89729 [Melampsora larici-populina 98AG31]